jgi:hypothetical protein
MAPNNFQRFGKFRIYLDILNSIRMSLNTFHIKDTKRLSATTADLVTRVIWLPGI